MNFEDFPFGLTESMILVHILDPFPLEPTCCVSVSSSFSIISKSSNEAMASNSKPGPDPDPISIAFDVTTGGFLDFVYIDLVVTVLLGFVAVEQSNSDLNILNLLNIPSGPLLVLVGVLPASFLTAW